MLLGCLVALAFWSGMARAQIPVPTPGTSPGTSTPSSEPPSVVKDEAQLLDALIHALETPEERAALLEKLRALRLATTEPAPEDEGSAPDLVAATIIDEFATGVRRRGDDLREIINDVMKSTNQLPLLAEWLYEQITDNTQRTLWIAVVSALFAIVAVGLVARLVILRMRPPLDAGEPRRIGLGRFMVEIVGAMVFGVLTLGMLWLANVLAVAYAIDLAVVANAALSLGVLLFAAMLWGASTRLLFGEAEGSDAGRTRLLAIPDRQAELCRISLLLIGRIGLVGFGLLRALNILGMPDAVFSFLVHILFLIVAFIAIVLVLRLEDLGETAIMQWAEQADGPITRFIPVRFLAQTWHYFAIVLILLHYLVWALKVPGGIVFLSRATLSTIVILIAARLAVLWINRAFASGPPPASDSEEAAPTGTVQARASRYTAPARVLLRACVIVIAVLALLSAWNTGIVDWLFSDTGMAFVGLVARLSVIIGLTLLTFEATSFLANRFINAKDQHGKPLRSNRSRTLAGIIANLAYFTIGMAGIFTALSHLGVEAAPLIAGAGVVGLAIGFGSQALVRDLITGLFMLLGDIIRVGDVVDIAGKAGVVEGMSMRTISLRGYDGSVHTIPYGSVDVVTNLTKEFSFAVLDIRVAYRENTDEVIRVIREIDDRMRKEWPYRRLILEPIDVAGVDNLDPSAVVIRMRSKTRAGEQWGIRREFLRRIKLRFDELGIEVPFPHQTIYFGAGKDGKAPPLHIEAIRRGLAETGETVVEPEAHEAVTADTRRSGGA